MADPCPKDGSPPVQRRGPRKATAASLANAALSYLARFATSRANLRAVLMRRVERSVRHHGTDPAAGAALVDALLDRYETAGLLDDRVFAEARAAGLRRQGASGRAIRFRLARQGVDSEIVDSALAAADEGSENAELAAAAALARKRRLGPYRAPASRAEARDKDLAALARAGFSYDVARRVIEAATAEDIEI
jgi:regulatory protein